MLERGLPAFPEPGGWFDQTSQFCHAFQFIMAERCAVREELGLTRIGDTDFKTDG